MKKSVVYIDGFNFYYGLLRDPKYRDCKWLDLARLFAAIRQDDDLVAVRYFTAFWPDESGERHKQYVGALSCNPLLDVRTGRFKRKTLQCGVEQCTFEGSRRYRSHEEKETDVNIALAMIDDAYQGLCDRMILVTADSDLVPAVNLVKDRFPSLTVLNYIPGNYSRYQGAIDIRTACDDSKMFPAVMLRRFQLPAVVEGEGGRRFTKPEAW